MLRIGHPRCLAAAVLVSSGFVASAADSPEGLAFFEKEVRPVLINRCYECHSAEKKIKGGLALDSREAIRKGGESGPVLEGSDPDKSKLIEAVRYSNQDLQMPPKGAMPASEVKVLEQWVKMGAPDPREALASAPSTKGPRVIDINEGRKHWAFTPLSSPSVPEVKGLSGAVKNPIDKFVLTRLQQDGLTLSAPTDKLTLIRRATFDLIGLPPTPDEVADFVNDTRHDAFDRVIERLLASPQYGERWARHWLDVARYADSNGLDENVALGHAWRYRDYVVRAFNNDKPYDQFVIEQIAGDLLPHSEDALSATGFLALGAKVLAEPDVQKLVMDVIDEQIDTMGKAFLGMTLGCVRCHDHKFDPIKQDDYYALAAIFKSTKSLGDDRLGALKFWYEHSLATPEQMEAKKHHDETVKKSRAEVTGFIAKARTAIKTELHEHAADYLAAASELNMDGDFSIVAKRYALRPRYLAACRQYLERHPEHALFAKWRELKGKPDEVRKHYAPLFTAALATKKGEAYEALTDIAGFLAIPDKDENAFDAETFAKIQKMNDSQMAMEDKTPDPPAIMGVADGEVVKTLPIHIRGSYLTLGKPVERGFIEVMRTSYAKPVLPAKESGRLELARWMASSEHPLTARVMVNRLWRWHFGKGIVGSTDNFGLLGDKPSNPALLDWLARTFIANDWSVKDMHRLIMKSATYQQSSGIPDSRILNPDSTAAVQSDSGIRNQKSGLLIDPENRLHWRANIQRLEAEEIRDAMLATSGWLIEDVGGKTVPQRNKEFVFNHTSLDHTTYETPRRALYLPIIRNHLYDMLEQFDFPDPTMPTGSRYSTVIAPQALIMMNAPIAMQCGEELAKRIDPLPDDEAKIKAIYARLFGRTPTDKEKSRALVLLSEFSGGDKDGISLLCQTLMASNEFMYLR